MNKKYFRLSAMPILAVLILTSLPAAAEKLVLSGGRVMDPESGLDGVDETEPQCIVLDVAGPTGQVNHGTIMSAFARGLKDLIEVSGYDGPRGHFVREVARGDHGKSDHRVGTSSDEDSHEDAEIEVDKVEPRTDDLVPPPWVQEKKDSLSD